MPMPRVDRRHEDAAVAIEHDLPAMMICRVGALQAGEAAQRRGLAAADGPSSVRSLPGSMLS